MIRKLITLASIITTLGFILFTIFTIFSFIFMSLLAVFGMVLILSLSVYLMRSFDLIKIDDKNKKIKIGKEKSTQKDRIENIKQKFVDGKISEDELEKELDNELGRNKDISKEMNRVL